MRGAGGGVVVALAVALGGCRGCGAAKAPVVAAPAADMAKSALCGEVHADQGPDGRWSVQFDTGGLVLKAHGDKFFKRKREPNGPAWVNVVERCMTAATVKGIEMNEEAGAFFAWAEDEAAKDRLVAALCKALDDGPWIERCVEALDRDGVDD